MIAVRGWSCILLSAAMVALALPALAQDSQVVLSRTHELGDAELEHHVVRGREGHAVITLIRHGVGDQARLERIRITRLPELGEPGEAYDLDSPSPGIGTEDEIAREEAINRQIDRLAEELEQRNP
ncbi:hypothetical protein GLV89_06775 [Halomonas alkaliantarctica]|nr:hypothetical protein [Halomonas alkaliantarctica]